MWRDYEDFSQVSRQIDIDTLIENENDCELWRMEIFGNCVWKSQSNSGLQNPPTVNISQDVLTARLLSLSQQKSRQTTYVSLLASDERKQRKMRWVKLLWVNVDLLTVKAAETFHLLQKKC